MRHGVGVIGAGPGLWALHAPTLARLSDELRIVHIADAGSGTAEVIAGRSGARWSSGIHDLLADAAVDVVVVCSPPAVHADHVLAAVAAGKRAIFCEKPLATSEADAARVIDACRAAGVALLVGTNHLFDGAWNRAKHHLTAAGGQVRALAVTMALPPNDRYHDVVTESTPAAPRAGGPPLADPNVAASVVRQLLVGLAVHDLPLLRDLAPDLERVVYARAIAPIGYAVGYVASGVPVRLTTVMLPGGADALWRLDITTDDERIEVTFPPAFVHDGSAAVRVRFADGRVTAYPPEVEDGYVAEWRALLDALGGTVEVQYDELLEDARYALRLADAAAAAVLAGSSVSPAEEVVS
ncbi:Gfo/Idh/MocA family protein [Microbacterium sp. DT81.1]|uniref:Gfo/Idh/MocA family protein n=1 Tax=Microbacterium sp. DT81.1 TaxID=3393413 RepID=UPI003CF7999F